MESVQKTQRGVRSNSLCEIYDGLTNPPGFLKKKKMGQSVPVSLSTEALTY